MFNNKVVVRAGWGIYYDRGELFTYLSPGFAAGVIPGGPFGVNQSPPYVNSQLCNVQFYQASSRPATPAAPSGGGFENPWGAVLGPPPTGNPATLPFFPMQRRLKLDLHLFAFADYNRANKLPYTLNQTSDIQWQPRNDLAIDIGYVGNLGRHEVIPIPFNQAQIASPTQPTSAGYARPSRITPMATRSSRTQLRSSHPLDNLPNGQPYQQNFEGGNVDLRVPYHRLFVGVRVVHRRRNLGLQRAAGPR